MHNLPRKTTITITDDHPMLRDAIKGILQLRDDLEIIGTYGTGEQLLHSFYNQKPDLLLLDLQLPDTTGDQLVPKLFKSHPELKIIILTGNSSVYNARMLLDLNVQGYLLKNLEQYMLFEAIDCVNRGDTFVSPELQRKLFRLSKQIKQELISTDDISEREVEILNFIANEYKSQEIADKLGISLKTVENHRLALMQKLDTKNMIGMVKKGMLLGLIK